MELPHYALEYDENLDAIASLEMLVEIIPKVITVPHYWKWVILSLHSAMQGFMVLALQGTNDLNVLTERAAKAWIASYEEGQAPQSPPKLDYFMNLFNKICSVTMLMMSHSKKFDPTPSQRKSVNRLHHERNNFVHYVPALSLLDMREWAELVLEIIPVIEFLAFESNNVTFPKHEDDRRVRGLCSLAKSQASALIQYYGA